MDFLLFVALATALAATYVAHKGALWRNPAIWYVVYAALVLFLAYKGAYLPGHGFLKIFPSVLVGLGLAFLALRGNNVLPGQAGVRALLAISFARIPVEFMLHQLAESELVPQAMSWNGSNFDIVSGVLALLLFGFSFLRPIPATWLRAFTIVGLLLLGNIVITAALSFPFPWPHPNADHPNVAVLMFPYTALPTVIVPLVFYSHLRLWKMSKAMA
jgi:hypothetical protein